MRRTIYRNRFLVDEVLLNNTENSKIAEILLHHEVLGEEGIIEGLNVTPSSTVDGAVDVSSGSAVLPNKEIVELPVNQSAVTLASFTLEDINIIVIAYEESFSNPKASIEGGANHLVFVDPSPSIRSYTSSQYLALSQSERDSMLVISVVTAAGSNVAIPSSSIYNAKENSRVLNFSGFKILKGVIIKSTTVEATPKLGSLRYNINTRCLSFVSPNNPSFPDLDEDSSPLSPTISIDVRDPITLTLTDSTVPGDQITVEVYGSTLPQSFDSFDPQFVDDLDGFTATEVTPEGFSEDEIRFQGSVINEFIDFLGLYSENRTEIDDDIFVETKRATAVDSYHRNILGSGLTNENNPHGLSLSDIVKLFENIPGAFRIGDALLATPEEANYPRILSDASQYSRYTLLFESELPSEGSNKVNPLRIYLNANTSNIRQRSGIKLILNAKFNPLNNTWIKDNASNPSLKIEINSDEYSLSFSLDSAIFDDNSGWESHFLTDNDISYLKKSLAIVPKSNAEHNDTENTEYSGLINVRNAIAPANKIAIYEDRHANGGGMRIYMGRDTAYAGGDNVLEFSFNAKPVLGTNNWQKDNSGNSYLFRYRFNSGTNDGDLEELLNYQYTGSLSTFPESSWSLIQFELPGGMTTEEDVEIFGSVQIETGGSFKYEEAQTRKKIIPLSDVGYQLDINLADFDDFADGSSPQYIGDKGDEGNNNDRFVWSKDDSDKPQEESNDRPVRLGLTTRIITQHIDKNQSQTEVPKLYWIGPEPSLFAGNTAFGFDGGADAVFINEPIIPEEAIHTWTFPIQFEESNVIIKRMELPFDWQRFNRNGSGIDLGFENQTFDWSEDFDPLNRWFKFRLVTVNYISGNIINKAPPNQFTNDPISWEIEDNSNDPSVPMVIKFRNPTESNGNLISIDSSNLQEEQFLQLIVQTNRTFRETLGQSLREYRPMIVGQLIIHYTTFNIE